MTYAPTIQTVRFLANQHFPHVDADKFFAHWSSRNWVNNSGTPLNSEQELETALNVWEHHASKNTTEPKLIGSEMPKVLEKYQIKAIPTRYDGIVFRSRTEARWAVFFNSLKLRWEYEREGFEIGESTKYLPDFWLPQLDFWVEIKGADPDELDCDKAHKLSVACERRVYVFFGGHTMPDGPHSPTQAYCFYPDGGGDHGYCWCECSTCGMLGIEYAGRSDRLKCKSVCPKSPHGDKGYNYATARLCAAFSAARSERFSR